MGYLVNASVLMPFLFRQTPFSFNDCFQIPEEAKAPVFLYLVSKCQKLT